MTRTISIEMTWKQAAQIIAAALENGTSTGRDAARAELSRMAHILDALKASEHEPTALWEVITTTSTGEAYGQTFENEGTATAYAEAMQAAGYRVDPFPEFVTQPTLEAALKDAAEYYGHPEILDTLTEKEPLQ